MKNLLLNGEHKTNIQKTIHKKRKKHEAEISIKPGALKEGEAKGGLVIEKTSVMERQKEKSPLVRDIKERQSSHRNRDSKGRDVRKHRTRTLRGSGLCGAPLCNGASKK